MKTFKRLYARVHAFENLYWAFRKARQGKRIRPDVAAFEFNLELELADLQEQLANETYRPGPYRHFTLYERKPRRISAARYRDRTPFGERLADDSFQDTPARCWAASSFAAREFRHRRARNG